MTPPIRDIPLSILQEKNVLATLDRFIWLYEVTVPTEPQTLYRLTRGPEPVSLRGETYSPFPITHDTISRDSDGDLPTTSITVSNVSREIIATLENHTGLIGQPVKIILAHSKTLGDSGSPVMEETFRVISSSADAQSATFRLGSMDLYEVTVPKARMTRFHCRHLYQSSACGYALSSSNANYMSSCDKSIHGATGCAAHGRSYTAAGLTPVHPDRFGGFPGIPVPTTGGGI